MDPETRKKLPRIFFFLAAVLILVKITRDQNKPLQFNQVSGLTMGTIPYVVKYRTMEKMDLKYPVDSLLQAFNQSLSTYIGDSEISRFNQQDTLVFESPGFYQILASSRRVFDQTEGAFDPTVGPLVNAWGFGPEDKKDNLTSGQIDSLLQYVGFEKVFFNEDYVTKPRGVYLDFSAIAKGQAIDQIAGYLDNRSIRDYMIEIGGEVRTRGKNDKNKVWSIGIEDPMVDREERKIGYVVRLGNRSVATSGNYRNYYEKDGKMYAHIIDPRTGYTSSGNLLSASVFASDCITADAYATAFMVMGLEMSLSIVENDVDLDAILVYQKEGDIETTITDGIREFVSQP